MRIKMVEFYVGEHSEYLGTQFDEFFGDKDVVFLGTKYTEGGRKFAEGGYQTLLVFYAENKGMTETETDRLIDLTTSAFLDNKVKKGKA